MPAVVSASCFLLILKSGGDPGKVNAGAGFLKGALARVKLKS